MPYHKKIASGYYEKVDENIIVDDIVDDKQVWLEWYKKTLENESKNAEIYEKNIFNFSLYIMLGCFLAIFYKYTETGLVSLFLIPAIFAAVSAYCNLYTYKVAQPQSKTLLLKFNFIKNNEQIPEEIESDIEKLDILHVKYRKYSDLSFIISIISFFITVIIILLASYVKKDSTVDVFNYQICLLHQMSSWETELCQAIKS